MISTVRYSPLTILRRVVGSGLEAQPVLPGLQNGIAVSEAEGWRSARRASVWQVLTSSHSPDGGAIFQVNRHAGSGAGPSAVSSTWVESWLTQPPFVCQPLAQPELHDLLLLPGRFQQLLRRVVGQGGRSRMLNISAGCFSAGAGQ